MTIWEELAAPFAEGIVGWKAQTVTADKKRCMVVAYIDARDVMDRLDAVIGPANWRDEYEVLQDGCVKCTLSIRVPGAGAGDADADWLPRQDVGGPSDQNDVGDKLKAAFSDALKRAAVKFGIGRYLYALPPQWVAYDEKTRGPARTPAMPTAGRTPQAATNGHKPAGPLKFIHEEPTMTAAIKDRLKAAGINTFAPMVEAMGYKTFKDIPVSAYKDVMKWIESQGVPV